MSLTDLYKIEQEEHKQDKRVVALLFLAIGIIIGAIITWYNLA
jgi:cytochrome c biogenesis factor